MDDLRKKLLAAGAAAVLGLALIEVGLRLLVPAPPRGNLSPVPPEIRMDTRLASIPYLLRPLAEVVHAFPDDPRGYFDPGATLTYRINSLGFRGPETTRHKPEGVFRILALGDSFTFGTGVRAEDTFAAALEARLGAGGGAPRFEVLNLGVMGYATVNEVALLRQVGLGYEPDLVLICFFLNDTVSGPTHALFNVAPRDDALAALARRSRLVDQLLWTIERRRQTAELLDTYRRSFEPDAPGWVQARHELESAASLARAEGFAAALVIFPVLWDLGDDYPFAEIHRRVAAFAEGAGLPTLDLLPAFAGYEGPELWVHPTNQHPNEIGHAIAGRALAAFLRERGLVPAPADDGARALPSP